MEVERQFIQAIRQEILHIEKSGGRTYKESLELLAFSILVMLDGMSGSFDFSIDDLRDGSIMLHDLFYEKDSQEEGE